MIAEADFQPRLDILPAAQLALWGELVAVPLDFVLYGKTALALRLGHRQSVDFDFFADRLFQPQELIARIPFLAGAAIIQQAPNTLNVIVDRGGPVKLSFFGVPAIKRLRPPSVAPDNTLRVASILDLAGTKASVVQQRAEAKDYIDIDAILQDGHIDLPMALSAARAIYGPQFNPLLTLKALTFFGDGDLGRLPGALKARLVRAVGSVDPESLAG